MKLWCRLPVEGTFDQPYDAWTPGQPYAWALVHVLHTGAAPDDGSPLALCYYQGLLWTPHRSRFNLAEGAEVS